ncbi:MAG: hypothetical protein R3213_07605, partial [Flavobacteriaceae bacterium]|nr:hypothetical protein [Flavobacteriaceae bacterium]
HVGLIFQRSSVSKKDVRLCNAVGVIDSGYRGEIKFRFDLSTLGLQKLNAELDSDIQDYQIGDKVGQLVIVPFATIHPVESDFLEESERGEGGFGSTGDRHVG